MAFVMMIETVSQIHTVTQTVMSSLYSNWKYMALAAIVIAFIIIYNAFVFGQRVEKPNEPEVQIVGEGPNFPERPPVGDQPADAGNDNQQVINGEENPDKHNKNENSSEVDHSGAIVHEYIDNNRGSEDGNKIGQNEKPENVIDPVPQIENLQSVHDYNVSEKNNPNTDPVPLNDSHTEDQEYTQQTQEQDKIDLPEHVAPFPHTDTRSTITNPSPISDEAHIEVAIIELSQDLLKNEIKGEEVVDLNAFTPIARTIETEIADRQDAEIILEDDIDKKDQATPLEKTSPEILASISNTLEEHEYMIPPIEVKEGKIDKSLWVVNYPYPGTCKCLFPGYCVKDFTSDLSETDSFDVKKLHV